MAKQAEAEATRPLRPAARTPEMAPTARDKAYLLSARGKLGKPRGPKHAPRPPAPARLLFTRVRSHLCVHTSQASSASYDGTRGTTA